jgi:hypothetical protein
MLFCLMLCRCFSMFGSKQMMSMRQVSVVAGRFVVTSLMLRRCLLMVAGGVFVVFGGLLMMLRALMHSHFGSLLIPRL